MVAQENMKKNFRLFASIAELGHKPHAISLAMLIGFTAFMGINIVELKAQQATLSFYDRQETLEEVMTTYHAFVNNTFNTYIEKMIEGYDIAFSIPAAPNDYGITHHAVLANKAVEQTVIRVNGKKIVKTLFYIMDPNRGQYCRFDFKHLQPRAFLLSPQ